MTSYTDFFAGSATVAGALVGLLFVALAVSPERLRDEASVEHQSVAATAFTALVDALFISLIGLQPGGGLQVGAVIFGALGLTAAVGLTIRLWRSRVKAQLSRRWPFLLSLIALTYTAQLISGLIPESPATAADRTATFIYIMFGTGIARSWELLGLSGVGLVSQLGPTLISHAWKGTPPPPAGDQPAE